MENLEADKDQASHRLNLKAVTKSTESSHDSVKVPKLDTGASYRKELHKEEQPLILSMRGAKK